MLVGHKSIWQNYDHGVQTGVKGIHISRVVAEHMIPIFAFVNRQIGVMSSLVHLCIADRSIRSL